MIVARRSIDVMSCCQVRWDVKHYSPLTRLTSRPWCLAHGFLFRLFSWPQSKDLTCLRLTVVFGCVLMWCHNCSYIFACFSLAVTWAMMNILRKSWPACSMRPSGPISRMPTPRTLPASNDLPVSVTYLKLRHISKDVSLVNFPKLFYGMPCCQDCWPGV